MKKLAYIIFGKGADVRLQMTGSAFQKDKMWFIVFTDLGAVANGMFIEEGSIQWNHPEYPSADGFCTKELNMMKLAVYPSSETGHTPGCGNSISI